jgi:hypothetical protein
VLARAAGSVAVRVYAGELSGSETKSDQRQVEGFTPLLSALSGGQRAAVNEAVTSLVFSHTHVVRLRVTRGSTVLADIGGPYILAPVGGTLRFHGQTVGHYVLSVQDDLGYVKLVTRFIGAPVDIYSRGAFVMGTLSPAPPADAAAVSAGGNRYAASALAVHAFPAGPLQASLFVPEAPSPQSCAAVRLAAFGSIARHVATRLHPLSTHLRALADIVRTVTGARLLVRSGAQHLAGGGPARLPRSGSVRFEGRRWAVYSWQPLPNVRAFLLAPAAGGR